MLSLGTWMAVTITAVVALAYWDAQRESAAALSDFAREQATLASGLTAAVSSRVSALGDRATEAQDTAELFADVRGIEEPSGRRLLLSRPGTPGLSTTDEMIVRDAEVEDGDRARLDGRAPVS